MVSVSIVAMSFLREDGGKGSQIFLDRYNWENIVSAWEGARVPAPRAVGASVAGGGFGLTLRRAQVWYMRKGRRAVSEGWEL